MLLPSQSEKVADELARIPAVVRSSQGNEGPRGDPCKVRQAIMRVSPGAFFRFGRVRDASQARGGDTACLHGGSRIVRFRCAR